MEVVANHYVLAVHDLERTRDWFERVLGCTTEVLGNHEWMFFKRDGLMFMCGQCPDAIAPAELADHSYFAYLKVDDARAFYEHAEAEGAEFIKTLRDESWGMREFGMRTVDGHRIMVGQALT